MGFEGATDFEASLSTNEATFKSESFWVQLHNLPLAAMTEELGKLIGSGMGKVLKVEFLVHYTIPFCFASKSSYSDQILVILARISISVSVLFRIVL
ncbi:uncharacterized protein LOC122298963 [Carya illinoinensis]|uniref:uncharacterized protein LOC122298963 n=1 Tax=Carya illinoinensis TaxID=32201 RepID=UPI001C7255D5|nr:uncharacterized protein LOC122298963 [Carya illinoinensis]